MPSEGKRTLAGPGVKAALGPFVQDLAGCTNREASREIQKRWAEIWAAAEPLGLTKSDAWQVAWAQFKAVRRAARAAHDRRFRPNAR